ncbi:1-deoxy-D-xylulose-5-phosphate synthase [Aureicoccus marinus]|uniref:1-deoxy-D-xylulose-5-phosphate synthase n=1 Tax=Aureicoccus marinus TaxID=754435 RepID=A0A2S7T815_9FLAO|nr:1-deoxy-D-xylulose-5-phosphate synthase [Aureicoccus marinus]PQJ16083.1 1-deoxy-D-xylulose-5-phosphate synthase [Aureicoccus marinus]
MGKGLEHINGPEDLRKLAESDLVPLAEELRQFIIEAVAEKGGHLGASLGVVELTIALHRVFDTPHDRLVWDVGHQAYGHKILTGRRSAFGTNRQFNGLSGFPKRSESPYDAFGTGHSSTSISAVLGMALAGDLLKKSNRQHIAVIGDASLASGMAFEALNHLGSSQASVLVILNDNGMSIDPSVGALHELLQGRDQHLVNQWFTSLGLAYSGPVDGHDLFALITELKRQKTLKGPRLLHIKTVKGKGLPPAEVDQVTYHAPGKFEPRTGERKRTDEDRRTKFQDVFGETLVELGQQNPKIVGITPAMPTGSSLGPFMEAFPDRSWDVGIAEQHAVTLSAGLATEGLLPFCAIYSTFLQRAYDQVIHDVALQNLSVIFCLDRAGLVGQDGATHHGVFDLSYLNCIPHMSIGVPRSGKELRNLLYTSQLKERGPVALRYPRGYCPDLNWKGNFREIPWGKGECLRKGSEKAVVFLGPLGEQLSQWLEEHDVDNRIGLYDMRFLKPLDETLLQEVFDSYAEIWTLEDGTLIGGLGSTVAEKAQVSGYSGQLAQRGLQDTFIEHGSTDELNNQTGLSFSEIGKELLS